MLAERFGQSEFNLREALGQFRPRRRQIAADVDAGRQKIRHEDDAPRPLFDAANARLLDARLSEFQKRRFKESLAARSQPCRQIQKIGVGLLLAAAVGDEQQGRLQRGISFPVHKVSPL